MLDFRHELPQVQLLKERHPFVVERCRGKNVLHVGCVDAGLLKERFATGELLHSKLHHVACGLWGVDVDESGIQFLRDNGFENVFVIDLTETGASHVIGRTFDVIILSEVLEHLPNPGLMLEQLKCLMAPGHTELIVSVPNAFSVGNVLNMARAIEHVHPDHNYYFSYVTLRSTVEKAGFKIREQYVYLFDTDLLPSHILRRIGQMTASSSSPNGLPSLARRAYWRIRQVGFARFLPEYFQSLLAGYLLQRSGYWGDGLLAICVCEQ